MRPWKPMKRIREKPTLLILLRAFIVTGLSFFITFRLLSLVNPSLSQRVISPLALFGIGVKPVPTPDPSAPKNILLLGYGGGEHEGGELTDTMIVAHIRPKEKRVVLVTVPRDLWVSLPAPKEASASYKINEAYVDGGRNLAIETVTKVTNLPIDHVIVVNFKVFLDGLKPLEPLSIVVPKTFIDPYYPIDGKENDSCGKTEEEIKELTATMAGFPLEQQFPCRYETLNYSKGTVTMTAEEALKFVRSRHGDDDFGRSERQAALIKAIKDKVSTPTFIPKLIPMTQTLIKAIDTDIAAKDIPSLFTLYHDFQSYSITSVSLTVDNVLTANFSSDGQYILLPKDGEEQWKGIWQFIKEGTEATTSGKTQN